jgi:hypothetical protein
MNTKVFLLLMSVMLMPFFGMVGEFAYGDSSVPPGDWDFCSPTNPGSHGQGDCDSDADCQQGLKCTNDVGPEFGFAKGVDVCVGIADSVSDQVDDSIYGGPGDVSAGDSNNLLDLLLGISTEPPTSTTPSSNDSGWECSYHNGDPEFCAVCRPNGCLEGEGECANWTHCADGLVCVNKVCVKP